MDHRSPLRDLTAFNIENIEKLVKMENNNEVWKPRHSVIKAFDPLYDSPKHKPKDFEPPSDNSFCFESTTNGNQNDENLDPLFSNLIDISNVSDDVFMNDVKDFIEEIIDEALSNVFPHDSGSHYNLNENSLEIRSELEELKLKLKVLAEENHITQTELHQHISSTEQLKILMENKDADLVRAEEELLQIKCQNEELKLKLTEYENAKYKAEDEIIQYKEKLQLCLEKYENKNLEESNMIQELQKCLSNKNKEIQETNGLLLEKESEYVNLKLKVEEYENAKNKAEKEIIQYKEKLQLYLEKDENKNLEESNMVQELQKCLSNKNKEIQEINDLLLEKESECVNLELKVEEYEDLLESYSQLLEKQTSELDTLREENCWVKKHLSSQEMAFGDVYHKYERCKKVIEGYKINEEALKKSCEMFQDSLSKYEDNRLVQKKEADLKYANFKTELTKLQNEYKAETSKLLKKMKHLEIRNASLTSSLEQKTLECQELTDLCQEITERG